MDKSVRSNKTMKTNHTKTIAITVVVLAAMTLVFYFTKRVFDAPGDTVNKGIEVAGKGLNGIKRLKKALGTRTIKTEYASTATKLAGTSRLQVATIHQVELFERLDSSTLIGIPLPDVVISAKAPIEYTYYFDLKGDWKFILGDKTLKVTVPALEFNTPAIDASAIEFNVIKGSIIRSSDAAKEALRKTLTEQSKYRAKENIGIAREAARREAQHFVRHWLSETFNIDESVPIEVYFADEIQSVMNDSDMD